MTFRPNMTDDEVWAEDMHRGRRHKPEEPPAIAAPQHRAYSSKAMNDEINEEEDLVDDVDEDEEIEEDEEMDADMTKSLSGLSSFVQKSASYPEDGEDFGKPCPEDAKKAEGASGVRPSSLASMGDPSTGTGIAKSALDEFVTKSNEEPEPKAEKALNTRSFYVPPPREAYDPFSVHRSVSTVTTRNHSALRGPEGVAPLVGETFAQLFEDDKEGKNPNAQMAYKSCPAHGISYRADRRCHPCSIAKSTLCKCGSPMEKSPGGTSHCPNCG